MTTSRSSSNTSAGGSQSACVRVDDASLKNWRCSASACDSRSQACANIQSVGSVRRNMDVDPLHELRKRERARVARDLAAFAEDDERRNAANPETTRELRLGFGIHLGEADARCKLLRCLLVGGCHHPARTAPRCPEIDDHRQVAYADVPIERRASERNRQAASKRSLAVAAVA